MLQQQWASQLGRMVYHQEPWLSGNYIRPKTRAYIDGYDMM